MNILFLCGNPNDSLLDSLKNDNQVISCGPSKKHDIQINEATDIKKILKKSGKVDLIFFLEQQPLIIPQSIEKITIPKAVYLVDLHIHYHTWHKHFAQLFDLVFCAQKKYVEKFKKLGLKNVFWLPLYCNQHLDKNLNLKRIYDVGFVGSLNHLHNPKRSLFLWLLNMKFWTKIGQNVYGKNRTKILNQAKITFNYSNAGDLNFRTFETMACGAMLLTNKQDGMFCLFKNRTHLVTYNNFFDAQKIINFYLNNPKRRQEIAKAGQVKVLKKHSAANRAREIIKIIKSKAEINNRSRDKILNYYSMGRAYFFNYQTKSAVNYLKRFTNLQKKMSTAKLEATIFSSIAKYSPPLIFRLAIIFFRRYYRIQN